MQDSTLTRLENLFLALSDKTRLRLLALMVDGEVPVGDLVESLGDSQPKISRHLAYLRSAGLVSTRRDGKWIYYGIEAQTDAAVARVLDATLRSILSDAAPHSAPVAARGDEYVARRDEYVAPRGDEYVAPRGDEYVARGDEYIDYDAGTDVVPDEYRYDWAPAEMEIFLL